MKPLLTASQALSDPYFQPLLARYGCPTCNGKLPAGGVLCHTCNPEAYPRSKPKKPQPSSWEAPELVPDDLLPDRERVLRQRYTKHQYIAPADLRRRSRDDDRWTGPPRYIRTAEALEDWLDDLQPTWMATLR